MNYYEKHGRSDRKLLLNAERYCLAKRVFVLLALLSSFGALTALFHYSGPNDAVGIAKYGFVGAVFWLFCANAMHLRICHVESIRHYLKEEK